MSVRIHVASFGLVLTAALSSYACAGSGSREGFDGNAGDGAPTPVPGDDTGGGFAGGDAGASEAPNGCSDEAKLVYVLSLEGDVYSFAPADKKFTKIGPLDCPSSGPPLMPISMAVDRDAVAWVNMREDTFLPGPDRLYKFNTKTAKCEASGIEGSMGGMGFSTNGGSSQDETLFVIGAGTGFNGALLKVDFAGQKLVQVADLQEQVDLELTGTGDGRLYAFLIDNPLALAKIDKSTTALSDRVDLPTILRPQAPMFAFSFWGGDFYFYTADSTSPSKTTTVARYRPSDSSVDEKYMDQIGFHIVGAGVSTCAPVTQPK